MRKLFFALSVAVLCVSYSNAAIFNGSCGDNLAWSFNDEDSTLVITGSGQMISTPWSSYAANIAYLSLPDGLVSIADKAFNGCGNLKVVEIPNSVRSIGDRAFRSCKKVTSIQVPVGVTSVHASAFANDANIVYEGTLSGAPWGAKCLNGFVEGCLVYSNSSKSYLAACSAGTPAEMVIPSSVNTIQEWAFSDCDQILDLVIPNSVVEIGGGTFARCSGLQSVKCYAVSLPTLGEDVFFNVDCSTVHLYVPQVSLGLYQNADQWSAFSPISAIEEATGIDEVNQGRVQNVKFLEGGQVLILREGHVYSADGVLVK